MAAGPRPGSQGRALQGDRPLQPPRTARQGAGPGHGAALGPAFRTRREDAGPGGPVAFTGLGLSVEDAQSYPALTGKFVSVFQPPDPLAEADLVPSKRTDALRVVQARRQMKWGLFGAYCDQGPSVGVGIATGEDFVGNIQAVDRMIWSAIGNTTNLAARLQSMTRELDAALVIDSANWGRAQAVAADFTKRPDVPIRGRRQTQDFYAFPLSRSPT